MSSYIQEDLLVDPKFTDTEDEKLIKGSLFFEIGLILSVPKFTANLNCICLSIPKIYT